MDDQQGAKPELETIVFRSKVFKPRNSVFTDLFENDHMRSVYNLGMALCIGTIAYSSFHDYYHKGCVYVSIPLIINAFAQLDILILIWFGMFFSTLVVYYGFKYWANGTNELQLMGGYTALWDVPWTIILLLYFGCLLYFPPYAVIKYNLGVLSTLAILMEQLRFVMKMYAFVRSNCPKYLKGGLKEKLKIVHPTFSHYLYFWFAPTLVYQDNYPRANRSIRWGTIAGWLLQQGIGTLASAIIWENSYKPGLMEYGLKPFTTMEVILVGVKNAHLGLMIMLLAFYYSYHCYFNIWAELLGFEDRLFYSDWWISSSLERFLRSWSIIMHDWLYLYLYKDVYEFVFPNRKLLSKIMVYVLLAVGHDYIICFSCRIYLPLHCILYTVTVILLNTGNVRCGQFGNVLLWLGYTSLVTTLFTIFTLEYYARQNCPLKEGDVFSHLVPRFLQCQM
ncbi:sterol O-acyltransferase 1-like [Photinus pyralis]|uniref:sterol O-acyltransferase 1-like n=1 Tax=Photinus pyralis TaxID=7054 RepID=UPI0012674D46|nr:sterol O-acyltransferase 1-like [Photinus pyralis]